MIVDTSGLLGAWKLGILDKLIGSKTVSLIFYELGNVFWKMEKRQPRLWNEATFSMMVEFVRSGIEVVEPSYREVLRVAKETGLTFYDAAYLWLARKEGKPILTLDRDFKGVHKVVAPPELLQS